MITKQLEEVIKKYNIKDVNNIIYGTNIPMPNKIIITPWKTSIRLDETKFYFFLFNDDGITLYSRDGSEYGVISWKDVVDFKIKHIFILGKMTIKTKDDTYSFQINRFVFGCPWIKNNTKYLEKNNYFYKK